MTVIATIITQHWTAHASDSFITRPSGDGDKLEVIEDKASKIVRVEAYSGAIAYWGLAFDGSGKWNTLAWLQREAGSAARHGSPASFARHLALTLTAEISKLDFRSESDKGLGLHFTAYERVNGYFIPELFQIRNWTDESYTAMRTDGFEVRRETYGTLLLRPERPASDGAPARRIDVHTFLHHGTLLRFVNGDPILFNPVASAVLQVFDELQRRHSIDDLTSPDIHLNVVRRPIELVSRLIGDFVREGRRRIGGKPHDLCVGPGAKYHSTTGD